MVIQSVEELRALYQKVSGRAKDKVFPALDKHSKNFIHHSPFLVLSTVGSNGKLDASPRGGEAGFVKILSDNELLIADSKGNNRLDSLSNIVETGEIGMLLMIPGVDETLRINGTATISTKPELLSQFSEEQNPPRTCIVVKTEQVFLHCAKAFMRSKLWNEEAKIDRSEFPTMGEMLNDQLNIEGNSETQREMVERYKKDL